ncbi:serine/threonine-protein kinase [Amycolatopsis mediterranei]|uniref:serine/threonine-protein kinase n=1 Tax=Amycolatopsis mediterranei TaxID=33910 RepID=UPI00343A6F1E
MGRRELPLAADAGPIEAFADALRRLRVRAGTPSYRLLARKAGYSASALSAAASGAALPSLDVALAYAGACGGRRDEWEARWRVASAALALPGPTTPPAAAPGPPTRPGTNDDSTNADSADYGVAGDGEAGAVFRPLTSEDPRQAGAYRLRARIGVGGMGRVYLAYTPGGRALAVKVVRPELAEDTEFRRRFQREVAAARRVHGLFTAQVLDADTDGSQPWLATAYVPAPSLAEAIGSHGPLPVESMWLLVAGLAEAMQTVQAAGLVHRDLKPSNVLLAIDGPRLIDFGIARASDATQLTRTGIRIGSPQFMAPEHVLGKPLNFAADIFALGGLIGYAATGRGPFGDGVDAAVLYRVVHEEPELADVPGPLRELATACLDKDPGRRPDLARIIETCRTRSGATSLKVTGTWLPAAHTGLIRRRAAAVPPDQARRT